MKEVKAIENREKIIYRDYKNIISNPPEFLKDAMNLAQAFSNTKTKIHHEHDKMIKKILENKKEAADFINRTIKLYEPIEPEDLINYNKEYITEFFEIRAADVVYKFKNNNVFFLIEHQRKVDYSMPYRIFEYKSEILKNLEMFNMNNYKDNGIYSSDVYQSIISDTIVDIANHGGCVILGRNANNILKGKNNVINIFIYSNNLDFKIRRKMKLNDVSYEETKKQLKIIDKQRKKYYESINKGHIWGSIRDYDYCIDSSLLGVDKTADMLVDIYNNLLKK